MQKLECKTIVLNFDFLSAKAVEINGGMAL